MLFRRFDDFGVNVQTKEPCSCYYAIYCLVLIISVTNEHFNVAFTIFLLESMYSARAFASAPRFLSRLSRRFFSTRTQSASTSCTDTASSKHELNSENPLLSNWSSQPFHLPPFSSIQPTHFDCRTGPSHEGRTERLAGHCRQY